MRFLALRASVLCSLIVLVTCISCNRSESGNTSRVRITGSDTMVNLAQAWQEEYNKKNPDISIQVKGGGSGVGIADLISGKIEIATASRPLESKELELAKKNTGKEPLEFKVGLDALAIYVHKENPIEKISIPELKEIYGKDGKIETWKALGVENPQCKDGSIIRVSRQNSSGTYKYFQEAVLGKGHEYKQGAVSQSGSSDVVALVSNTPCAIGYSGMGYRTPDVKVLSVCQTKDEPGIEPSIASATDGSYPISRPLFLYTLGEPTGSVKAFIDWILSEEGQKIVEDKGYVPLPK